MDFEHAFTFLRKLARQNNREWFEKNKGEFLEIKSAFEGFAADVYHSILSFDESIAGQDPKKCVFRIYRDVRFSKDKKPYKTFLSAGFSPMGKGTGKPGYYLQLEPGDKTFVCAGLFSPLPDALSKIRQEIDYNGEHLQNILVDRDFKKLFNGFWQGDALKTAPKGYAKDHAYVDYIKLKSFVTMHRFSDEEVFNKTFLKKLSATIKAAKPLNDFLTQALD